MNYGNNMNNKYLSVFIILFSGSVMADSLLKNSAYDSAIRSWGKTSVRFENGVVTPFSSCEIFYANVLKNGPVMTFEDCHGEIKEPDMQVLRNVANECYIMNDLTKKNYQLTKGTRELNINSVLKTYPATLIWAFSSEQLQRKTKYASLQTLKQYSPSLKVKSSNELAEDSLVYKFSNLGEYKRNNDYFDVLKISIYVEGASFRTTTYHYIYKNNGKITAKKISVFNLSD